MLPPEVIREFRKGRALAASLPVNEPEMSAFVMVIPRVRKHFHTIRWKGWYIVDAEQLLGRDEIYTPALLHDYEIRYLKHRSRYTETDWGWDYDCVLEDPTTRVRRVFVKEEAGIELALSPWLRRYSALRPRRLFNSSLVNSPLDAYLLNPAELPHLWLE